MDGENNGKPYEQMDDLGGFPIFLETPNWAKPAVNDKYESPPFRRSEVGKMGGIQLSHGQKTLLLSRLQICPLYIFGNKATDGT